ncbi:hypothetical protein [Micromonospora sp. S-DT3-3-22]|uniref:hypothetical protein n=1 Tax=Micromonospora sp. S-DT3-3-22 TaxID=2755359 RepID=UPI0018904020|nr:hypothetical protein [Micromonospora sp. S-DT3-3-22]
MMDLPLFAIISTPEPLKWTEVGGFWVGVGAGLLGASVTAVASWVAYRSNRPKRLLRWKSKITPVTDDNMRKVGLRVFYNEEELKGALVAEVDIMNACRKDFASSDFEDGKPLEIRVKGRILNILKTEVKGSHAPHPAIEHTNDNDGNVIRISPCLIPAGSSLHFRLLLADDAGATIIQHAVFTGKRIVGKLPEIRLVSPLRDVVVKSDNKEIAGLTQR